MNKRIYLILEIKKRELDSRCYFAIKACLQGYSTMISKKESFYKNKNYLKSGYVFLKSCGPNYYNEIKKIKKLGHKICVMDEEGIMYFSVEDYTERRIYEKNLDYLDYIFTWGNDDHQIVTNVLDKYKNKIFKTGSPRIDVLKKPTSEIYQNEAKEIKKKYQDFFLFNTFFTYTNHFYKTDKHNHLETLQARGFSKDSTIYKTGLKMQIFQEKILKEAINFVEKFAIKFSDKKLIIRPHPSENHELWFNLSKKYKNIETIYDEKSACSWILASEFAISSNCTTSVEAFLLGKLNYNFRPFKNDDVEFKLPKITGINISSADEMIQKIDNFSKLNIDHDNYKKNYEKKISDLNNYFENLNENSCSIENIINIIEKSKEFNNTKKNDNYSGFVFFYYLKLLRKINVFRSYFRNFLKKKENRDTEFAIQKFPGLSKKELENRIKETCNAMKLKEKFKVIEKFPGSFLIEKEE
tara:strand:- start:1508 stop:2914 length:1407 start_codon:yes stop_codon:yes gene_type:complete